jgi:hypothetical protein
MASRQARILILCKTYPSPSGKHIVAVDYAIAAVEQAELAVLDAVAGRMEAAEAKSA